MEEFHSPSSSPRVSPEGIPDGLVRPDSGIPESELSQFQRLERNTAILNQTAAVAAGIPASAVLPKPQTAAVAAGIPASAVLPKPQIAAVDWYSGVSCFAIPISTHGGSH